MTGVKKKSYILPIYDNFIDSMIRGPTAIIFFPLKKHFSSVIAVCPYGHIHTTAVFFSKCKFQKHNPNTKIYDEEIKISLVWIL